MIVDDVPIRSVLVVDDRPEEVEELVTHLKQDGVTVLSAQDADEACSLIERLPELDLVILDWYLESDTSAEALMVLKKLSDHLFAPVVVWTKHSAEVETTDLPVPRSMLLVQDKGEVRTADRLVTEIRTWLAGKRAIKIGLLWSFGVQKDLNRSMWDIQSLSGGDLTSTIASFKREPIGGQPIPSTESSKELVLLLLKALTRNQLRNHSMIASISKEIAEIDEKEVEAGPGYQKLREFQEYLSPPLRSPVWTGDMVRLETGVYKIVITPSCDIAQAKLQNIQMLSLRTLKESAGIDYVGKTLPDIISNRNPRYHFLPYAPGSLDFVCYFEEATFMPLKEYLEKVSDDRIHCIATLDSPFIENLLQRYVAFLGRLGVPNLPDEVQGKFRRSKGGE